MQTHPENASGTDLAGAEDLLRLQAAALEAAVNPIIISKRDGTILWVNKAFEQLSGYTSKEAIGQSTRLLKSGQQSPSFYENMWRTILSGQKWQGEMVNQRKDGTFYQEEMTITPVKNGTGDITHFIAIKLDITERKRAEARVCRLAQVVENSAELIAIGDPDGRISFVNEALLQATGYQESDVVGELFGTALISGNNPPRLDEEIRIRTIFSGGWRGECFCRRKDDTNFPIFLSTGQIKDNRGVVIGIFGIAQDIADRKRLEEQLLASQKMEAVGRLAGGVAHDFNNLLGVITGYSDLLLDGFPSDDPRCHQLQQIKKAGGRATSLTRQLLAFSRKQIFQPNSRDAMPTGGKLIIETANADLDETYCRSHPPVQPGRYVMIAVSDTGTGMDTRTQARIFEPFFTTKEQGKGTGLGLATVYGVVKQSEGYIWVYSELGKGTTFKIYLPRIDGPAQTVEVDRDKVKLLRGSETILLAEDADALRELTCALLKINGYTVLAAENATEAIKLAERQDLPIHLLLTDVVMPGMGGRELANYIEARRPDIKVLYMSGYTNEVIAHHGVLDPGLSLIETILSGSADVQVT